MATVAVGMPFRYGPGMRTLVLALAATLAAAVPATAADDHVEPFDMAAIDAYFEAPSPEFGELLGDGTLSDAQCQLLVAANAPMPFEAEPAALSELSNAYRRLEAEIPELQPVTSAAASAVDTAVADGGRRQAMLELWLDRAGLDAIRELASLATNHCGAEYQWIAFGLADRILELARYDNPAFAQLEDIASWAMSLTGEPQTVYWSFGYLGDDPVSACDEVAATLASVGFEGTEVKLFRGDADDLPDLAMGIVGERCRPA